VWEAAGVEVPTLARQVERILEAEFPRDTSESSA